MDAARVKRSRDTLASPENINKLKVWDEGEEKNSIHLTTDIFDTFNVCVEYPINIKFMSG